MANTFWGVDSLTPANTELRVDKNTKKKLTLFDIVCEHAGRVPAFWGRYLDGHGRSNLTKVEADYIFRASKGRTRVLPIYLPARASVGGSKQQGETDAGNACKFAAKLGVPPGVYLWADIEPDWLTSESWLRGWWEAMFRSLYGGRGGIYEDPRESNGASFAWPYYNALTTGSDWRDYGQTSSGPSAPSSHTGEQTLYHQSRRADKPEPRPAKPHRKAPPIPAMDIPAATRFLWSQRPVKVGATDLKSTPEFKPTVPRRVENTTGVSVTIVVSLGSFSRRLPIGRAG